VIILSEPVEIVMHEWEEKKLPEDLAKDTEFLRRLVNLSDRRGRRVFDIVLKLDGRIAVKARGYVGVFVLKDSKGKNVVLVVEPKIGVRNVVWMLALSEARNFKEVREIENLISIPAGGESIVDLLVVGVVKKFIERLSEALAYGFVELPSVELEESIVVRGRILGSLLPRTLLASATPKVAYEAQYYTTNNPINRYILDAGYMLCLEGSHLLKIVDDDATTILKALFDLDYVPSPSTSNINVRELLSEAPLDRPYISELLKLAAIIKRWLEHEQPPYPREFVGVPALYINMNNLFESFVRKMMIIVARWIRRTKGFNITVRKAGRNERVLVISPRPKAYLEPDIVVEVDGKPIAVGDVKYKLVKDPLKSGSEGDRDAVNQVYTYTHGWDVEKGFLIYPSLKNETMYESYMLRNGKKLYIVRIHVDKTARTYKELLNSKTFNKLTEFLSELIEER
jgi:5-methylcytosine-specific restriction endonuclease McrBC regulatory subunit McrC